MLLQTWRCEVSHCGFASSGVILLPRILCHSQDSGLKCWEDCLSTLSCPTSLQRVGLLSLFVLCLGVEFIFTPSLAAAKFCPSLAFSSVIVWCSCVHLLLLGFHWASGVCEVRQLMPLTSVSWDLHSLCQASWSCSHPGDICVFFTSLFLSAWLGKRDPGHHAPPLLPHPTCWAQLEWLVAHLWRRLLLFPLPSGICSVG